MTNHLAAAKLIDPITERDRTWGLKSAAVKLLEYGDYECPHCHDAYFIVKELQNWLGNHLCFCFRHFPLTRVHPHAHNAAQAAEAAAAVCFGRCTTTYTSISNCSAKSTLHATLPRWGLIRLGSIAN
jgi:hypothetical protein